MKTLTRLASTVLLTAAVVAGTSPAWAIPEGGASPDTPGTSVSVSPKQLAAGERLSFTVSGFPAGEIVYVKIDDGTECDAAAVHGACVYHQQKISSSGNVSGSFALPSNLRPGAHWLRFLASEPIVKDGQQVGIKGYTARGNSDFTVVAAGAGSGGGTSGSTGGSGSSGSNGSGNGSNGSNGSTDTTGSDATGSTGNGGGGADAGQTPADGTAAGGVVEVKPNAKPSTAPTATATPNGQDAAPVAAAPAEQIATAASDQSGFPWVGVLGFVGLIVLSFVGTRLAMSRRQ